jgi:hypothetical protein
VRRGSHAWAFGAFSMYAWGHALGWAELVIAWILTVAIGIAIHFVPIARLLDGLTG